MANPEAQALLRIARRDLKAAEVLQIPSIDESSWGFQIQQAVEKSLKAWLPGVNYLGGSRQLRRRVPLAPPCHGRGVPGGKRAHPGSAFQRWSEGF